MNVGDLVTLSAVGKDTNRVTDQHKRFFRGPKSTYYGLGDEDNRRFQDYWQNDKMVGLVTAIVEMSGRYQYDWEREEYATVKRMAYQVAWQANPKALTEPTRHSRGHLKFVKKHKKNK